MAGGICNQGSVLVVARSRQLCDDLKKMLVEHDFEVCGMCQSLAAASHFAASRRPDLVVVDSSALPEDGEAEDSLEVFADHGLPVILVTDRRRRGDRRNAASSFNLAGIMTAPVDDGELAMLVTIGLARNRMERNILGAKKEWEGAVDAIHDAIFLTDDAFTIVRANRRISDALHLPYQQIIGCKCHELLHGLADPPPNCLRLAMGETRFARCERRVESLGGHFQITCYRFDGIKGKNPGFVHVLRDVTVQKQAEEKLKKDLSCLQDVIDGLADSVMVISADFRVLLANRAARRLATENVSRNRFCYGMSHGLDAPCGGEKHLCPLAEVQRSGKPFTVVHRHVCGDGREYPVEITASPLHDAEGNFVGIIEAARDISERVRLLEEKDVMAKRLFEQQKKDSVSRLTSGIAHQFNNLLMRVVGNAELLRMKAKGMVEIERHAGQILETSSLMAGLTRKMMLYVAAGDAFHPAAEDVNRIIGNVLSLTWNERNPSLHLVTDLAENLPLVLADEKQLSQLLVALLSNACEAMPDGGDLKVSTRMLTREHGWSCRHGFEMAAGPYVELVVSDTGQGIPSRDLPYIFDPFFSTRFLGRGLGLAMVDSIAQRHGGCVFVTTEEGKGSSFSLFLPAVEAVAEESAAGAQAENKGRKLERLLMVDDEPEYLDIISDFLREKGFTVLSAAKGGEALRLVAEQPEGVDLVLLDIQLDDMSGREVYRKLKKMRHDLPVLVISGYEKEIALEGIAFDESGDVFLQKPFGLKALLAVIKGFGGN